LSRVFHHPREAFGCFEEATRLGDLEAADLVAQLRPVLEVADGTFDLPAGVTVEQLESFNRANSLLDSGRYSEAASLFEKVLMVNPRFEQAWCNRGRSLRMTGDDAGALACYKTAVQIDPNDSLAWLNMGVVLGRLGHLHNALECYERAI